MPNKHLTAIERFAWAFLQTLWVGGIWISLLIIFPAIGQTILAPILVHDVVAQVEPRIIIVVLVCAFSQLCLFLKVSNCQALFKTSMGLGLVIILFFSIIFLIMYYLGFLDYRLRSVLYIIIALMGLFFTCLLPPWLQKHRELE